METTLTIELRSVYGQIKAYPICATARQFADLLGRKTLTRYDLIKIKGLGYDIVGIAENDWRQVA